MDDYTVSAEEAAAIIGISAKTLRQRLRDERPVGARQFPPRRGGNWFLQPSYVEHLATQRMQSFPGVMTATDAPPEPDTRVQEPGPTLNLPRPSTDEIPLGTWSDWIPFEMAMNVAPRLPGVYMFRLGADPDRGPVYIGMSGERKGNGLRGRLSIYASGKGAGSGLGEHALDRALEDPAWLRARLSEAVAGTPMRAKAAARSAIDHAGLEVRWRTTATRALALQLELQLVNEYRSQLWNR